MLSRETIGRLAAELHDAEKRRIQIRHFSMRHPGMTIEDGYAIQRAWVALKLAEGRVVKGRKIGLTSRAIQLSSQVTEPDYARLLDDMLFSAGGDIPLAAGRCAPTTPICAGSARCSKRTASSRRRAWPPRC